jgi:ribosomal protein S18 acetylase RimI-like enzyme
MRMAAQMVEPHFQPDTKVGVIKELSENDLHHLCESTALAIEDGIGFNWLTPPDRETLEQYWRGVMMISQRVLIGAWLDGILCGAIQLVKPPKSKETSYFCANIEAHFVAPWARGHHLASGLLQMAEREASKAGFSVIRLSVRSTQERALALYRDHDYIEWGILPCYEFVGGDMLEGHFFYKKITHVSAIE